MSTQLHARKRVTSGHPGSADATESDNEKGYKRGAHLTKISRIVILFAIGCGLVAFLVQMMFSTHAIRRNTTSRHSYVTVVMPSVVNPSGRSARLEAIASTWGPSSHAIYVVHNVTEFQNAPILQNYNQTYPQLLLVPPNITVDDGLPRMNHVIRTIHEQINPDFVFFVNDHTYVIPEHLISYLDNKSPDEHMYAGHALKNEKDSFNSGAAGYFLSRRTMQGLTQKLNGNSAACTGGDNKWLQNNPGLLTATCLEKEMGVKTVDTRDVEDGSHRFHAFGLVRSVAGNVDQWYIDKHEDLKEIAGFDESYAHLPVGENCCSKETIAFHYVEYAEVKALFHIRQQLLDRSSMSDAELKEMMTKEWPKDATIIGAYSRPLPKEDDSKAWSPLLKVVRKVFSS